MSIPYNVTITHPATLWSTSMTDLDTSTTADTFITVMPGRKSIMYSKPDYTTVDGMEILISVYSPSGKVTAASITPEKNHDDSTKNLLGKIN
jgi:hypothetical protein